ncbi:MAG: hypothetical protein Q8P12_04765, partial [bacterium]|nr:hypothetical protein [bacterium]
VVRVDSKKGLAIVSRGKNAMGELIPRGDGVPHLRDIKLPKQFDGMVFRAELYHPSQPFGVTGSILLAAPDKALEAQEKVGRLAMAPHRLLALPGGKPPDGMSYLQRRELLMQMVYEAGDPYLHQHPLAHEGKDVFFADVLSRGGEGIVLKHHGTGESFKLTPHREWDLKIVGFQPGSGKFAGKGIRSFAVADSTGRLVGQVGSGLSFQVRQDAYKHPEKYLNRIIKVHGKEATADGHIRHPRFKGFTTDKHLPDTVDVFGSKYKSAGIDYVMEKGGTSRHARAAEPTPEPQVGDRVTVKLEDRTKMDRPQIVPMGDIPGTLNKADGDPWDAIPIDQPLSKTTGTVVGRVVGKIHVPDGNHK